MLIIIIYVFYLMIRRPPRSTRTDTLFPYTTLFRSIENAHKIMGLANTLSNQLEDIFNEWASVKVTDREVRKLIQLALCPNKETLDLIKKGAEDEISRSEEHTSELQSLMRNSYAVFCLKKTIT